MDAGQFRRVLVTVLVALLVATAGCNSLPGVGSDGGDGNDGDEGSDGGDGGAQGYDKSAAELDSETIADSTRSTIADAGSYTRTEEWTASASGEGMSLESEGTTVTKVDLEAEQGIRNETVTGFDGGNTVVYTDSNASYQKSEGGGETEYSTTAGESFAFIDEVNVTTYTADATTTNLIDNASWSKAGGTEVDGVGVTEYELDELDNETALEDVDENDTVESVSASLFIDSDGVIRKAELSSEYTAGGGPVFEEGTTVTGDVTMTLSDLGETSVEEPNWISEAQSK